MQSGLEFAGASGDDRTQAEVVTGLRSVSLTASKLLVTTKTTLADPDAPNATNLLAAAARQVTDSINQLITICTTAAPGQKECDNALRQIQSYRGMLEAPNEPVSDASYFDCLDSVMYRSKVKTNHMNKSNIGTKSSTVVMY